ncbi:hypothetical protein GCM10025859_20180 [Alicyclobacillus fastidiosus]|nr:hypothetical protein GCM10025859_20180 [Alicyclobacillus fastidiosus]
MVIGTHHGKFHADEVFAVAILKQFYPDAKVVRSRDDDILSHCDIVVDVGRGKYDHHSTDKVYRDNGIPYASAGLIWRDFGHECVDRLGTSADANRVVQTVDERLIQAIDAIDNGVDLDRDPRIKGISELIAGFNPPWNSDLDENDAFDQAVQFAAHILNNTMRSELGRMAAIEIVKEAYGRREKRRSSNSTPFVLGRRRCSSSTTTRPSCMSFFRTDTASTASKSSPRYWVRLRRANRCRRRGPVKRDRSWVKSSASATRYFATPPALSPGLAHARPS